MHPTIRCAPYESVQTIPVRVSSNGTVSSSLTPELVQARLRDELAAVKRELENKDSSMEGTLNQVTGRMGTAESKLATLPGEGLYISSMSKRSPESCTNIHSKDGRLVATAYSPVPEIPVLPVLV